MHRELLNVNFWRFNEGEDLQHNAPHCHFYFDPTTVLLYHTDKPCSLDMSILCYSYNTLNEHGRLRDDEGIAQQTIIGVYVECPIVFGRNTERGDTPTAFLWNLLCGDTDDETGDSAFINACNEYGYLRHDLTQIYREHARGALTCPETVNIGYPVICRVEPADKYTTWQMESVLDPYTFEPLPITL